MAHFAKLDQNNVVIDVLVIRDEDETTYADWRKQFGETYVQTSYNNRIRKQYAGIGFTYDEIADVFVAPQPFPSWTLDDNHDWQAPTPMPWDGKFYKWVEGSQSWVEVTD
jgi:hypothetical protein